MKSTTCSTRKQAAIVTNVTTPELSDSKVIVNSPASKASSKIKKKRMRKKNRKKKINSVPRSQAFRVRARGKHDAKALLNPELNF